MSLLRVHYCSHTPSTRYNNASSSIDMYRSALLYTQLLTIPTVHRDMWDTCLPSSWMLLYRMTNHATGCTWIRTGTHRHLSTVCCIQAQSAPVGVYVYTNVRIQYCTTRVGTLICIYIYNVEVRDSWSSRYSISALPPTPPAAGAPSWESPPPTTALWVIYNTKHRKCSLNRVPTYPGAQLY